MIWIFKFSGICDEDLCARGFWIRTEGFIFAAMITVFGCFLSLGTDENNDKWNAFILAEMWAFLLVMIWCWFWGITYLVPIAGIMIATGFYKKIRSSDYHITNGRLIRYLAIHGLALAAALFLSHLGREGYLEEQEHIRQAKKIPVIETVDTKDNYIFTKEYGLEKACNLFKAKKGSKIHRLPVKNGEVFVLVEKQ